MTEPETVLAGVVLEHPVMNAAGTCRTADEVRRMARSAVSAVVVGSVTVLARPGNAGDVFWTGPGHALNSLGLPNRGAAFYEDVVPAMAGVVHAAGKPLVLSAAGFGPDEYAALTGLAVRAGADLVELNLGCPNVVDGGVRHRIAAFDPDAVAEACRAAAGQSGGVPFGVKLSPYSDPFLLADVAAAAASAGAGYVVASNTFPNALAVRPDGRPVLTAGLAGLSGPAMKPVGQGQVAQFRAALPAGVGVIGVGGITTGQDVLDYLAAGACAVQAATVFWDAAEDPGVYGGLLDGL